MENLESGREAGTYTLDRQGEMEIRKPRQFREKHNSIAGA